MLLRKLAPYFFTSLFFFAAQNVYAASFTISSGSFKQGCNVSTPIYLNTSGASSDAANIIVHYNPAEIDILDANAGQAGTQISTGSIYSVYADNVVDAATGTLRLTGFSIGSSYSGSGLFAGIPLKSKPGVTSTTLSVEFVPGSTTDSNIAETLTSDDLLTSVSDSTLSFGPGPCTADTQAPIVSSPSPAPSATNVPLDSDITFHISDNQSGVDLDSLIVDVGGMSYTKAGANIWTSTGSALAYDITVNPATDFPAGSEIVVRVHAKDLDNNVMSTYQWYFNRPPPPPPPPPGIPAPPPPPATCASLGCFNVLPPQTSCVNPTICGNGICESTETPETCRFDCAAQPATSTIDASSLHILALDGLLSLPIVDGAVHVFPNQGYEVQFARPGSEVPTHVTLLGATGEYAMTSKDGGTVFSTTVTSPNVMNTYVETVRAEYASGQISTFRYSLVLVKPFAILSDSGSPVAGASVSLYRLTASGRQAMMISELHQGNPSATNADGLVSFLVSPGTYQIEVDADGFSHGISDPFGVAYGPMTGSFSLRKSVSASVTDILNSSKPLDEKLNTIVSSTTGALKEVVFSPVRRAQKDPAAQAQAAQSLITLLLATVAVLGGGAAAYGLLPLLILFGFLYAYERVVRKQYDAKQPMTLSDIRKKIASIFEYLDIPLFAVTAAVAMIRPTPFVFVLLGVQAVGFAAFSALRRIVK